MKCAATSLCDLFWCLPQMFVCDPEGPQVLGHNYVLARRWAWPQILRSSHVFPRNEEVSMLVFIIPLATRAIARDWRRVSDLCARTVESCCAQVADDFRV